MNFNGILVGAAVFLIIGICHPIVIKMEYYWGIHELLAQEFRVLRGWFPENPKRSDYYARQRAKYPNLTPTPSHSNLCRKKK